MSEQTANLCTTDACESLRALLAKYEDAEGRPLQSGVVDERAAFEAAYRAELDMRNQRIDRAVFTKDAAGDYIVSSVQSAWWSWLARASLSAPSHGGQVRQTVPDGYVLVPERMHLSHEAIESITAHCGDGQEDAGYGPYSDGVLWVGEVEEEDGSKTYGIHIATADYPEEGSTTLLEFSAAPSAGSGD